MTTKEKIVQSALGEFAEKGLDGARVDRIARRAGVNKAMIYYHFASKEALYQEVLEGQIRSLVAFLEATIEQEDPETFFRRLAEFYATLLGPTNEFAPIMLRELAEGGGRARTILAAQLSRRQLAEKFRSLVEKGKRSGFFRDVDSTHAIVSFIGMNLFYLLFSPIVNTVWEISHEDEFRKKRPDAVVDLFLDGLRAR